MNNSAKQGIKVNDNQIKTDDMSGIVNRVLKETWATSRVHHQSIWAGSILLATCPSLRKKLTSPSQNRAVRFTELHPEYDTVALGQRRSVGFESSP